MCSTTLSMSMYSYGCVSAVGVAVCVSCCIFLYNTTIMITSAVITDNNTNRISTIVIERTITIIMREETDESDTGVGNVSK